MSVYNRFYGFSENPFNQTPNTSLFFPSEKHKTALDALLYAVGQRKGFVLITGEIGCGKTTVARTLLRRFDGNVKGALITNTSLGPKGILTMILEDLGAPYRDGSKEKLILQLNAYLIQQMQENQNVVFIIDEAQNLSAACLEEIRMLSNLETEKEKLIQIVLMGQPELRKKLQRPELEQLRQRISVSYHLLPLNKEETKNYIRYRLTKVSSNANNGNGEENFCLFDENALDLVYEHSRGIPRVINMACDNALLTGFIATTKVITRTIVEEAISELSYGGHKKNEQIYQSA